MKYYIVLVCVLMPCVLLCGCGSSPNAHPAEAYMNAHQLDPKKDYSKSITGSWIWVAKQNNKLIGMGGFELKEKNNQISGTVRSLVTGLAAMPGMNSTDKDPKSAIVSHPVAGIKFGKEKIRFDVVGDTGVRTSSAAIISGDGRVMIGNSTVEQKVDGKQYTVTYQWKATRTS